MEPKRRRNDNNRQGDRRISVSLMNLKLSGKTVIVTGGSSGIGAGICKAFAREKANILLNYRSQRQEAESFALELRNKYGIDVLPVCADVTDPKAVEGLYQQAKEHFSSLDVLVNNAAGNICFKPFLDYSEEDWRSAHEGICDHVFRMSQHFLRDCINESREGRIINILSKSAFLSSSVNNLTYVTNKGALAALTRGMAKEFIRYGVYVNGVVPGYVKTRAHMDGSERTKRVEKLLPLKEFAEPEEIGNVAVILASPLFRQMIGAIVDCTGGTMI